MDENVIRDLEKRLYEVEKRLDTSDITTKYADEKFVELRKELKELKTGINKVLWTLGLIALAAVGNFIIQGGLSIK